MREGEREKQIGMERERYREIQKEGGERGREIKRYRKIQAGVCERERIKEKGREKTPWVEKTAKAVSLH